MLKKIGSNARYELEQMLEQKVNLKALGKLKKIEKAISRRTSDMIKETRFIILHYNKQRKHARTNQWERNGNIRFRSESMTSAS